jgi:uncharacterized membrane protein
LEEDNLTIEPNGDWGRQLQPTGGAMMIETLHLWAVGYDAMDRAEQVREEVARLGESRSLTLVDTAVAVIYPDGSVTLNGERFVSVPEFRGHTFTRLLAALALAAPPLTGPAVGAQVRAAGGTRAEVGIDESFINDVQLLMEPGTSALFVLDQEGDMPAILRGIRGLGGRVLRTNVDVTRVKLIQSTLAASDDQIEGQS